MSQTMTNPILSLRVLTFNDQPVAEPIAIAFGPAGGTIGRATDCTLTLPDPERAISRVQARIEYRDGEYFFCDLGSNASVLNQRVLGGTREARLTLGDRLAIGAYLLEVRFEAGDAARGGMPGVFDTLASAKVLHPATSGETPGDPFALTPLDPLGQPGFGAQARLGVLPGYIGSESDHAPPEQHALSMPEHASLRQGAAGAAAGLPGARHPVIPHDFDPFAAAAPGPASASAQPPASSPREGGLPPFGSFDPLARRPAPGGTDAPMLAPGGPRGLPASLSEPLVPGGAPTPFDDLLSPPVAAPASALKMSSTQLPPQAPPVPDGDVPTERHPYLPELTLMPGARATGTRAEPPLSQRQTESGRVAQSLPPTQRAAADAGRERTGFGVTETFQPSHPAPASQPSQPSQPSQTSQQAGPPANAAADLHDDPTLAALLDGLGIDARHAPALPAPEFARLVGVMLRGSLEGTMSVLRSRTMTKREARLDATLIAAFDNNPLKFFPDVDSALLQMFSGKGSGYVPPAEAVQRAFGDLAAHELAVMAGMRAALAHVLKMFDPAVIEAQLDEQRMMRMLSNRKAKMWDRFVALQAKVERTAADDFQKLFGDAFNEAYERQIEALRETLRENDRARKTQR